MKEVKSGCKILSHIFCQVTYKGTTYSGYLSLCAAVNRALDQGILLTQPLFYGKISEKELGELLVGDNGTPCPLLEERTRCLHGKMIKSSTRG